MAASASVRGVPRSRFVYPRPQDRWWITPLVNGVVLVVALGYGVWAAFQGTNFKAEPYLSPLYSPDISVGWWPLSPALLILLVPLGLRSTCYYYRKAYYRAFFWDPPACAVPERRINYSGETRFPFVLLNFHRYFLYLALIYNAILGYDAVRAFIFDGHFGVGVGSVLLAVNAVLLLGYSLSCHSLRHLLGGNVDCYSCSFAGNVRNSLWQRLTSLNHRHNAWAWASLVVVMSADLYVRLVASGAIVDPRIVF